MPDCKCNFREYMVGDGCSICNPELHTYYLFSEVIPKFRTPWEEDELQMLDKLNQHDKGGVLTWANIAERINDAFENGRTGEACRKKWRLTFGREQAEEVKA